MTASGGGVGVWPGSRYVVRTGWVGTTGRTKSPVKVKVEGNHTCLEDLNISLVSPSGRWYYLQRSGGFSCHPLPASKTYDVAADETAAGTWTLRIGDNGPGDTGTLTGWSITV